jgi:putative membrane protein
VAAAGFRLPGETTRWQRASKRHRTDKTVLDALIFGLAAIPVAIFAPPGLALIPIGLAVVAVAANLYAWEFRRFALGEAQIFSTSGLLSPTSQIATRLKLHSVEIAQGPLARRRDLRARVLETIAATDYSRLDQALNEAQSGLSANFLAT